ncbi:MAG: hypothetical protein IMF01_06390, partial [Proteobacteria bacterium]|nr:hypothetical protein [Pseudomonadota bacterium]
MRRKSFVTIFVLIVAVFLMTGCASHKGSGIPGISMGEKIVFNPLQRSEYEVLGPATGKACVTVNTLFPLPIVWYSGDYLLEAFGINEDREYGVISAPTAVSPSPPIPFMPLSAATTSPTKNIEVSLGLFFTGPGFRAKEAAVFRAIESVPGADAIISPRFYVEK